VAITPPDKSVCDQVWQRGASGCVSQTGDKQDVESVGHLTKFLRHLPAEPDGNAENHEVPFFGSMAE
ncbi:MAG: hypothetical protein O2856_05335, partial [Planctomycetota bacterium]|nr:hypothetical protein [Planctomycetota bacterium]